MNSENRKFASKSLAGFAVSPNPEAYDLENILGINFTNPPARIDLTRRNRLVFVAKEFTPAPIIEETRNAFYLRDYNAFFTRTGIEGRYTAWHENMHGYIDTVSSEEPAALYQAFDLLKDKAQGKEVDPSKMERIASGAAFAEGLADWAAIKTAIEIGTEAELMQADRFHRAYTEVFEGRSVIEGARNIMEEEVFKANEILSVDNIKSENDMRIVLLELVKSLYFVGYSFMIDAMKMLREKGFSISSAIDHLIKNPPTKIQDLRNPNKFTLNILR